MKFKQSRHHSLAALLATALLLSPVAALADNYHNNIQNFKNTSVAQRFFNDAYAYAVFPTVGKGSFIIGGGHGEGKVYKAGKVTGISGRRSGLQSNHLPERQRRL